MRMSFEGGKERLPELLSLMENISEKLIKEGVPISSSKRARIDCDLFVNYYGENKIRQDKSKVEKIIKKENPKNSISNIENAKNEKSSEKLEMIKTAIFNKFIGDKYITVRTAVCDDFLKGVDNIFIDKKTGDAVCAFDEVCLTQGERFENKKKEIMDMNKSQGGSSIDYGIKIKNGQIEIGPMSFLPLFYIPVSEEYVKKVVNNMKMNSEEISETETKLFIYFYRLLKEQIDELRKKANINSDFLRKISTFEKTMEDVIKNKNIKI